MWSVLNPTLVCYVCVELDGEHVHGVGLGLCWGSSGVISCSDLVLFIRTIGH